MIRLQRRSTDGQHQQQPEDSPDQHHHFRGVPTRVEVGLKGQPLTAAAPQERTPDRRRPACSTGVDPHPDHDLAGPGSTVALDDGIPATVAQLRRHLAGLERRVWPHQDRERTLPPAGR